MPEHQDGQSVAAWTAVIILLAASFLICLAVVVTNWTMAFVGTALVVVGIAAGKILAMAGYGQAKPQKRHQTTAIR
jgi:uncharacterized membrane protein